VHARDLPRAKAAYVASLGSYGDRDALARAAEGLGLA